MADEDKKEKLYYLLSGIGIGLVILFLALTFSPALFLIVFPQQAEVTPIFSPDNGAEIVHFIESANKTLDIEIYTFSSAEALNAVLAANDKGVKVRIILEHDIESATNQKTYDKLRAAGIDIRWASQNYALTHAKFIIIDGKLVLVGSHNLSKNALEKNREASVIFSGSQIKQFQDVFEKDWNLT